MVQKRRQKKRKRKSGSMSATSKQMGKEKTYLWVPLCVLIGISALLMVFCLSEPEQEQVREAIAISREYEPIFSYTRIDLNTEAKDATRIDLSKAEPECTITNAGDYLLYGDYEGQVCIDAEEQIVHLFLENVEIMSPTGPAIDVKSAGKVIVTLVDGTSNTIEDKAYYRNKNEEDAVIYSNCDLTFNGNGSLSIYGFYNKGIHSKDIIKILGGDLSIQAKGDGIQGNDGLRLEPAVLFIESEGNGLHTKKAGNENKGTIEITGGDIRIIARESAVSSSKDFYVTNCSLWSNSVLETFHVSGSAYLMEGCIKNE